MENETYGMVAYTISLEDNTFSVKDFGVYNLYQRTGNMHVINTERLAQQMESK